ncbi:hypothetical protein [Streptomyces sp. A1547]|uniref:hypothetical protein n=1 Tax=Streptomyces sp. A1547 TaxID=2563105 RepID=UPI00109E59FF|nr:hypothetical protein [Streptomyces sp. A1547]THA41416.1 hypothetical protein E6W17_00330 [Streptomyces sp. A1547]
MTSPATPDAGTAPESAPGAASGARAGTPPPSGIRPAPWVRTRLSAAPLTSVLAAALAFVAVLLSAALPRAMDRGADQGLRSFLHDRGASATSVLVTSPAQDGPQSPEGLDTALAALLARTGPGYRIAPSGPVYGARGVKPRSLDNPELARPEKVSPTLHLMHVHGAEEHVRLVEGRWPGGETPGGPVPVALPQQAAQTLGAKVGTVLQGSSGTSGAMSAEVVGLFAAHDEADVFWTDLPCPTHACQRYTRKPLPEMYWEAAALVGPDSLARLGAWGGQAEEFWRLPVDTDVLRADQLPATGRRITAYMAGQTATDLARATERPRLRIASGLPALFAQARAREAAAAPLAAIGPAGVAGVALVVFCLAGALTGDRRAAELRLLHARGGSRRGILLRLLGEGAVTVLPAAALATSLAVLLLPTPRWTASLLAASAAALFALLAFPVRAAVVLSARRGPRPRRRLAGELLVLVATGAAVFEVRLRGIAPAGEGVDPLLVTAPLLLALCGGLVLARLVPALVGALAWLAGRRSGLIGFLGLARAARGTGGRRRPSVLPVVALLLAITTGGFGAAALATVDSARSEVARVNVGGDAQVTAPYGEILPQSFLEAAAALPGVRLSVPVWTDDDAFVFGTEQGSTKVRVVVADPVTYAQLARAVGWGEFDPARLAGGGAGAPVPALFSRDFARLAGPGPHELRLDNTGALPVKGAGVVEGTPALPGVAGSFLVLPAGPATAAVAQTTHPTRWFALGSPDKAALDELVRAVPRSPTFEGWAVHTSADEYARLARDPLGRSAARLFWASVAGAGGLALLAVLLTMVRAAPERAALLARLRTMGLRPRQGVALILTEALPQALAAALGGALVAAAAVALLGPAVDLSALVGTRAHTGVRPALWPVLTQALILAGLVAAAVLAEAAVTGRRQITTELRAGDQR